MESALKKDREDFIVVRLDATTFALEAEYPTVSKAAAENNCTKENIYQSLRDGSVRLGSIWMYHVVYESWLQGRKETLLGRCS